MPGRYLSKYFVMFVIGLLFRSKGVSAYSLFWEQVLMQSHFILLYMQVIDNEEEVCLKGIISHQ